VTEWCIFYETLILINTKKNIKRLVVFFIYKIDDMGELMS